MILVPAKRKSVIQSDEPIATFAKVSINEYDFFLKDSTNENKRLSTTPSMNDYYSSAKVNLAGADTIILNDKNFHKKNWF